MPAFTVYAIVPRPGKKHTEHKVVKVAVHTIYERITDYQDLKNVLLDAAREIFHDPQFDHRTRTIVSMEIHRRGRYYRGFAGYATDKVYYKREPVLRARILYLPHSNEVKIERANFIGPEVWDMKDDYRKEKGLKWEIPRVVPKGFEAMLHNPDPELLFRDLLTVKTSNYNPQPMNLYASTRERRHEHGMYAAQPVGMYAGRKQSLHIRDEAEEKGEI